MFGLDDVIPELQLLVLSVNVLMVLVIMPLKTSISRLESSDNNLSDRIQHLELKLAENYIRRDEVNVSFTDISRKLERIEVALSSRISHIEDREP